MGRTASNIRHENQVLEQYSRRVFFEGATALRKGMGLCYDRDQGTAADFEARRDWNVELPNETNLFAFAGVAQRDYAAAANGQWIDIWEPGSVCEVAVISDTTVNSTILTCVAKDEESDDPAAAGFFFANVNSIRGVGAAQALQTNTAGSLVEVLNGTSTFSGAVLTDTGAFTNVVVGDQVIILGAVASTGALIADAPGIYFVQSRTDNALTLDRTISATAGDAVNYTVQSGPQLVLAKLDDSPFQTGLCEFIQPSDASPAAIPSSASIVNILGADDTAYGANSTDTLANGTFIGQMKIYECHGTITTNDYLVTVTNGEQTRTTDTDGVSPDGNPIALASLAFDADNERSLLEWVGIWRERYTTGATIA